MHIKSISITGFRSYRDKTVVDGLSRQLNVVVGQNGSGKSNFFAAIQFVLSSEFSHLTQEDRQGLLNEGTGNPAATATVEVLFDNSDRRLMVIDKDEFTISRTISVKKDQYFIDGRLSIRTEIVNLMESAGFSRSNPYYIVQQGKITELTTATDAARLKLMREVAGTRVYDDKKQECLKKLDVTKEKMDRSVMLLEVVNGRLEALEAEKEDLKDYEDYDKRRRALLYTLLKNKANDYKNEFDDLSNQRQEIQLALDTSVAERYNYGKEIVEVEAELNALELKEKRLNAELQEIREEEKRLECDKMMAEVESRDLGEQVNYEDISRDEAQRKLDGLEQLIKAKETELEELQPRFTSLIEQQTAIFAEIDKTKRKRADLHSKTGSAKVYNSVKERDIELKLQIDNLNVRISEMNNNITSFEEAIEQEKDNKEAATNRIKDIDSTIKENMKKMENLNTRGEVLRSRLDAATKGLHEKQSEHKNVSDRLAELEAQHLQLETSFYHMLPRWTYEGIRNMKDIIEDMKQRNTNGKYDRYINGYHGLVINWMTANRDYYRALEVTAGSTLSYHIVENDEIAQFFFDEINRRHMRGQCQFYMINRVQAPALRSLQSTNGRHLLSILTYPAQFDRIFRQIFGSTILVLSNAHGHEIRRNEAFNCVTLEGDEINRAGPMTGGYVDTRKSRLDAVSNLKALKPTIDELRTQSEKLVLECGRLENELGNLRLEVSDNEQKRIFLQREHNDIMTEKRELFELINQWQRTSGNKEERIIEMKHTVKELEAQIQELQALIGTPLIRSTTSQDARKIIEVDALLKRQSSEAEDILRQVSEVKKLKMELDTELNERLRRQYLDLKERLTTVDYQVKRHELQTRRLDAEKTEGRAAEVSARNIEIQEELTQTREALHECRSKLDKLKDAKADADDRYSNSTSNLETTNRRINDCTKNREDTQRRISDMGALTDDITIRFENLRRKDLEAQWVECLNQMKNFTNVNRGAFDQFVTSTAQRNNLQEQIQLMQEKYESIQEVMRLTEVAKNDALYLTFKQIAKNFNVAFRRLVPNGVGNLIMKVEEVNQSDREAVERARSTHIMERFTGVSIRVNFDADTEEGSRELFQLSGGQRTLVALALIFAIQKCDSAPFYLFDEIDASLDQEKRQAVASLINEFSDDSQFIATTFRPEMLQYAKRCYGVRFRNKVSYINHVQPEEAIEFLSLDDNVENENDENMEA